MLRRRVWQSAAIATCLLATLALVTGPASAQGRGALRRKQQRVNAQIERVQDKLRNVKAEQATARNSLSRAQFELGQAEDQLALASARLSRTRVTLSAVRREHKRAVKDHNIQRKRMEQRIAAQWEAGNPSYLEVLLDATSFADFTNRAEMTETIVERDQGTLRELLAVRQRLARRKLSLEEAERDQAAAAAEVRVQRNLVARRTAVAKARAKAADEDRAEIERQLAAMEEVSREVEAMLARVQRAGVTAGAYDGTWTGSLGQPTVGRLTSPFGWRMHPILHIRKHHDGIDIANSYGTPIRAAEKGRVIHAGWWGAIGESVIIDHGSGISTVYGHFTRGSLRVSTGEIVSRGQVIGAMGSTGRSTGSHLHFGVRRYGTPVNPLGF